MIGAKVHHGRLTAPIKETFKALIINSVQSLIRDGVTARLTSALSASNPPEEADGGNSSESHDGLETTDDEIAGFQIVRAIGAQKVDPNRIVMRDAKSYCAVLLDDNNRKTIVRLHFNSVTAKYLGTFGGKDEAKVAVEGPVDIYKHSKAILKRLDELAGEA